MTHDRRNLISRREILAGYLKVLDRPGALLDVCSSISGDTEELRRAVRDTFAVSEIAADAILSLQVRRFTPNERDKIRAELADVDRLLE